MDHSLPFARVFDLAKSRFDLCDQHADSVVTHIAIHGTSNVIGKRVTHVGTRFVRKMQLNFIG